jgi:hypothetical protein
MKVYVCTDIEGVTGVFKFKQTREKNALEFRGAMRLLMGDIAAGAKRAVAERRGRKLCKPDVPVTMRVRSIGPNAANLQTPWYSERECAVSSRLDIIRGSENRP